MSTITINLPTLLAVTFLVGFFWFGRAFTNHMERRIREVRRARRIAETHRERSRELSVDEIRDWARRNNTWVGSPAELIGDLTRMGYVVLTPDNWRMIQHQLEKHQQPTVQEWLERSREEDRRGGSGA